MGFLPFTSRVSPTIFSLLWASLQGYPPTHWLPRPLPLFSTCLLHHYSFHDKIPFCLLLLCTPTSKFKWIRIGLPHYLALWHASDGPNHLLLLLGKMPSQQGNSQKKSWQKTKYRPLFPPTTKPQPLNPLNRGPTSLILAGYRLVVLRPFCACFTIFCFCLLSFPRRFCHNRLVLFRSAVCFCLISSRVSCCVCHFLRFGILSFMWFLLLTLPAVPYFFSSCFFI